MVTVADQVREALRETAKHAEDAEERASLHRLAFVISDPAARQLRRLIR